jgi:hypothetical protein
VIVLFIASPLTLPFGLFRSFAADATTLMRPFVAKATEKKHLEGCKKMLVQIFVKL